MSTQRAFVIQFGRPGSGEAFQGRIEHVGTGAATRFASPGELLDFLFRFLGRPTVAAAAAGAGAGDDADADPGGDPPAPPSPARRAPRRRP